MSVMMPPSGARTGRAPAARRLCSAARSGACRAHLLETERRGTALEVRGASVRGRQGQLYFGVFLSSKAASTSMIACFFGVLKPAGDAEGVLPNVLTWLTGVETIAAFGSSAPFGPLK